MSSKNVQLVGGKERLFGRNGKRTKNKGIQVPGGFATTAEAYWKFLETKDLKEKTASLLKEMEDVKKTLAKSGKAEKNESKRVPSFGGEYRVCPISSYFIFEYDR